VPELEIRLPYSAWGDGDEWEDAHEALMNEFEEALSESGVGDQDDPDHGNEYISYFLDGDDLEALKRVAQQVLERAGLIEAATAFFVNFAAADVAPEPVVLR
jgi:hypothetical protein